MNTPGGKTVTQNKFNNRIKYCYNLDIGEIKAPPHYTPAVYWLSVNRLIMVDFTVSEPSTSFTTNVSSNSHTSDSYNRTAARGLRWNYVLQYRVSDTIIRRVMRQMFWYFRDERDVLVFQR